MLRQLTIENYAIIESLDIEFHAGLNTITGETGAGKSILLGALGLLSGDRADSSVIGDTSKSCVVEAVFSDVDVAKFMQDHDIEPSSEGHEQQVVVRRVITAAGRSRAFVNDTPVNLNDLRELSESLIDIHSQHQTLLLAHGDFQTRITDAVAGNNLTRYQTLYADLRKQTRELKQLEAKSAESRRQAEFLGYQIEQIDGVGVREDEFERLREQQLVLSHATEIAGGLGYCSEVLGEEQVGVVIGLKSVWQSLNKLRHNFIHAEELAERLNSSYLEIKDIAADIDRALDKVEVNPQLLAQIDERLDVIYTLCHKHNVETVTELLDRKDEMQAELDEIENVDQTIVKLRESVETLAAEALAEAAAISKARREVVPVIARRVIETLQELGIKGAAFEIEITPLSELAAMGTDKVRFLFSGNAGQAVQAIEAVASGGEMSRLMLSLKWLVSQSVQLPTIILDEIDTGVSGAVADKMGQIIGSMSRNMQVLNITHLPQVASKGENHYYVYKEAGRGTHIRRLTAEERVEYIATMLSGSSVTQAALLQAQELLKNR